MDSIADKLIKKIAFPVYVWEILNDKIKLIYTNDNSAELNKIQSLDEYSVNLTTANNIKFKKFIETKEGIEIDTNTENISFVFLDDKKFYEIRLPKCHTEYILSSISYKIRNPLTNLVGIVSLLDNYNKSDPNFQNYINIIKNSNAEIVSIVNDLIDVLNIKQNKIIIKKEEIHIDSFIKECFMMVSDDAEKKNLNMTFKIEKSVPKVIYSDKGRLRQIILNIIKNGIKYTKSGSVDLFVSLNKKDDHNPFPIKDLALPKIDILFKIKDSGIGISPDKKTALRSLFGISNTNVTKMHKLVGLGLYICKHLCNLMDGNIWFKSQEDIGTIFYFNIICESYK